jgi:ankyrin repeat protein
MSAFTTVDDDKFICACYSGHLRKVKRLVKRGVQVHIYCDYAFRIACGEGHYRVVRWLLENVPTINVRAHDDDAFNRSCWNGYEDISKLLLRIFPQLFHVESWHLVNRRSIQLVSFM